MPRIPLPVATPPDGPTDDTPWYAGGLRFRCSTCGNCCTGPPGYVWVTDDEVSRLATLKNMPEDAFRHAFVRDLGKRQSLREVRTPGGQYDCVFLVPLPGDRPDKRRRGCGVYAARPLQCRTWPFWHGLLESPEAWALARRTCPGLDKPDGRVFAVEEIESLRDADAWPDDPPSSK